MLEVDFPRTLTEFEERFGTEEACRAYLVRQRWPSGFKCPRCGHTKAWRLRQRDIWVCAACEHHVSLTAGTVLQGTRKPLRWWFLAMYLAMGSKRGLSAKELRRHLGCSYQTAWAWLHKMRPVMVRPDRERLAGEVEVDEGYVGGAAHGKRGRGAENKTLIVCAAEREPGGIGRIRLDVAANASLVELRRFVTESVAAGSRVHTDGWSGYSDLGTLGYDHVVTAVSGSGQKAHTIFPCVHRVLSLAKRVILGTYHGSVSEKHLAAYLQEYTFRFNRRRAKSATLVFQRLVEGVVSRKCFTYRQIVGGYPL